MATRGPKRSLADGEDFQVADKKTKITEDPDTHEVRVLIPSSHVGSIIGKKGSNVTRIRDECSVFMSILTAPEGVRERVLTVKGRSPAIALALHRVGEITLEAQNQRIAKSGDAEAKSETNTQIRFLVHSSLVGGVIGKGGSLVQNTQATTGARVQVSSEALPQCTEKTVTVSGSLENVYAALQIVVQQLKENPLRPGIQNYPYTPSPYYTGMPGSMQAQAPSPYGAPAPSPYASFQGYAPSPYAPAAQSYGAPRSSQTGSTKQKILIPTVCAGNVIGRGGSIISNIRAQSGTHISIAPADERTPHERMVTITGTPQGNAMAVYLIQQVVEQFESPAAAQGAYSA